MKIMVKDLKKILDRVDDDFEVYVEGNDIKLIDVNTYKRTVNLISKQDNLVEMYASPSKYLYQYAM